MQPTIKSDNANRTFDCEPGLTDAQVLEFCRQGFLLLEAVVPEEINQRTCDYLDGKLPANPSFIPPGMTQQDLERIRGELDLRVNAPLRADSPVEGKRIS